MSAAPALRGSPDPIIDLLRSRCCVNVRGASPGAGFFITPRLVITCAHVIGDAVPRIELRRGKEVFSGDVVEILHHENDDLALIELTEDSGVAIPLGNDAWLDDRLVVVGYPKSGNDQAADGLSAWYEARTDIADQRVETGSRYLHKFKSAHVVSGFSGGPLFNLDRMQAIGIVSHTRSSASAIGGWAIPTDVAVAVLKSLQNRRLTIGAASPEWQLAAEARARIVAERLRKTEAAIAGVTAFLPHATAIANFVASYLGTAQNPEPFGGRTRELQALDAWAGDDSSSPYLMVTAPLGRGKSALLVHWTARLLAERAAELHSVFVPISIRYDLNTAAAVFSALGTRLCAVHSETPPLPPDAPADHWRELVGQLLCREPPSHARLVVVLDGIDESAGWEFGPGTFPTRPAERVKVVLSARDRADRAGEQWLEALNWLDPRTARSMPLVGLDRAGIHDVVQRALPSDAVAASPTLLDELQRLSDGDPLVLSLYIKALRDAPSSREQPLKIAELPQIAPGLDGYFARWWDDQRKLWRDGRPTGAEQATHVLFNLLAVAFGPLGRGELLALIRRIRPEADGDDLDEAVTALARFVARDNARNDYVLAHPRFGAHRLARLRADGDSDRYERLFLDWGKAVASSSESAREVRKHSRYIVRHYSAHLDRAHAPPEDFIALLGPPWRAAWQQHADEFGGYALVLADVRRRLSAFDRDAVKRGGRAKYLGEQVRCAVELAELRDFSSAVAPEMLRSLLKFRIWTVAAALDHAAKLERGGEKAECLVETIPFATRAELSRVEQLLAELQEQHDDDLADVFAALCTRLWNLGLPDAAIGLVDTAPSGYPRATVCMALANQCQGDEQRRWLVAAFDEYEACDPAQRGLLVQHYVVAFMKAYELEHRELPARLLAQVSKVIEAKLGLELSEHTLSVPVECQYLEYVLPFLSATERETYISHYFTAILNSSEGPRFWYIGEFFKECAVLIPDSLISIAVEVIRFVLDSNADEEHDSDVVMSTLSLWPALTAERRSALKPPQFAAVWRVNRMPSIEDRESCFELLGKTGFTRLALDVIRLCPRDDWDTEYLISSVAPYLSEQECRSTLDLIAGIRIETQEDARRAVLGRLSSFSSITALEAQRYAGSSDVRLEAALAKATLIARANKATTSPSGLLEHLAAIERPRSRFNALAICTRTMGAVSGREMAAMVKSFRDDPLASEAFEILVDLLRDQELVDPTIQALVSDVFTSVMSINKIEHIAPYFSRAAGAGYRREVVDLVSTVSTDEFEVPWVSAAFGITEAGNDPELIDWIAAAADRVRFEWFRLAMLARLRRFGHEGRFRKAWEEAAGDLSDLDILSRSGNIARFLRQIPDHERGPFFVEFAKCCTFSLTRDSRLPGEAIRDLATVAPLSWLNDWAPHIKDIRSSSLRNAMRVAFGVRYAMVGDDQRALSMIEDISERGPLADALFGAMPHLPGATLALAFDRMLEAQLPLEDRLRAWAGLSERWGTLGSDQSLGLIDRWLGAAERCSLRETLLDVCGVSEGLERIASTDALLTAAAALERVAAEDAVHAGRPDAG